MERNNGRYTYIRRQGQQQHHHQQQQQQQQHQSTSSLSSSSSSSVSSSSATGNNNQHHDNHRNSSTSSTSTTTSSQFSSPNNTATSSSVYSSQANVTREPLTQHDELIRYIKEAWTKVSEQGTPVIDRNESDQLKNFKPFNLEEYWGQRLVQNIHVSHGHQ